MSVELADVHDFVKSITPFNQLPDDNVVLLVKQINICYVRQGEGIPKQEFPKPMLYILRKGALSYYSNNMELMGKFGEGDICTLCCKPDPDVTIDIVADEDTLLYAIEFDLVQSICSAYPQVFDFFIKTSSERLCDKAEQINDEAILASTLMNTSISDFYHGPAVTINATESIKTAAIKMTDLGFSCLVVVNEQGGLGIVTDKDIRRRCVAEGLSFDEPINKIMTESVRTIDINHRAYDALIQMTSSHIHHLPVTENDELVGMVTVTDLMNQEGLTAVNMSSIISKAETIEELTKLAAMLPRLQIRMVKLGTTADNVGKTISAMTSAFTQRLILMAKQQFGDEPVPFAWLAAGSLARQEQFSHSDQDNALIISDQMKPEDDVWFKQLATFVSDGLAACGFIYCPGDVMATNDKWRQSQIVWHRYFSNWIQKPDPMALMHCSIFFDLKTVYGDDALLESVRTNMLAKTKQSTLFIAHLSANAIKLRPPLGFFRDFVLISNGKHKKTLDLKHNGIAPIVDLARIYALSEGITAVNTLDRLTQAAGTSSLSKPAAASLISAYEFLAMLRAEHQATQLVGNLEPDNFLAPKEISRLEREHLKDSFKVIKTMQSVRQTTYS